MRTDVEQLAGDWVGDLDPLLLGGDLLDRSHEDVGHHRHAEKEEAKEEAEHPRLYALRHEEEGRIEQRQHHVLA